YQLMAADYPEGHDFPDIGFTYDSLGNRIHIDKQGTAVNYAANSMNQYTSVGNAAYAYDENGNLISDGESTYEYDYENRLISASNLSHAGISYEYDPFGRRIEKNVDGAITKYIYDGDQVICETDGSGIITAKYVYGAGIDEVVTMQRSGNTYFYHYDGLGNVTNITNDTGSVVESYSYDAYGSSSDTSSVGNPYLFNGRRFDAETGLYNYRARYYDPEIGRFLQTDPLGYYGNVNLYSYVNNNPLNWVDPFGLCKDKSFWEKFGEGYYFGTGYGQEALDWWATKWVETGNPFYAVGGGFAALWTPETWWKTSAVLGGAYIVNLLWVRSAYAALGLTHPFQTATIVTRAKLGADGAISQIIKIKNFAGKTVRVIHRVIKDGKIIHWHPK
ncbi:MAG: RHS repeat-associated core domain-containing protein, partial [Deltaproteobacteria bacterium]|nr:RHS repeat-associated core domain-containing protein [Deltaproteobacteria bacterium]